MIRPLLASVLTVFIPLTAAGRPNVPVVLTDDLGFSGVGCYGSEIETPTLARLASNGLRFSQFYNTAQPKTHPEWSDYPGKKAAKTSRKNR